MQGAASAQLPLDVEAGEAHSDASMKDIDRQLDAARGGVLLQPAPELGTLGVRGPDRQRWLNGLVTCDLAPLAPGQGAFGLSVAKNGKIQAELWIVLTEDAILVGLNRDRAAAMRDALDRYLIMEDAEIHDLSAEYAWLLAHGPRAGDLLEPGRRAGGFAAAIDRTGLGGAAFVTPAVGLSALQAELTASAGAHGAMATPEGWGALCVEQGLGRFGVDFDEQNYPQEASIERLAVSFKKGCYLGQETVYMLEVRGHVKKKLVKLLVEGDSAIAAGAEIHAPDGSVVGAVTSSHRRAHQAMALGYVKYKLTAPGTELRVAGRAARVAEAGPT